MLSLSSTVVLYYHKTSSSHYFPFFALVCSSIGEWWTHLSSSTTTIVRLSLMIRSWISVSMETTKLWQKVDLNIFTLWSWVRFQVYDVIVDGSSTWKSSFLAWHSSSISSSSCLLTGWIKEPSGSNLKNEELLKLQYKNEESSSCWHCDHKYLTQSSLLLEAYLKSCSQKMYFHYMMSKNNYRDPKMVGRRHRIND